jgi:hypothetical protein
VLLVPNATAHDVRIDLNVGNDELHGRADDSYANAGSGHDFLNFGGCRLTMLGGSGDDIVFHFQSADCPAAADGSVADLGNGNDEIHGDRMRRTVTGNGHDLVNLRFTGLVFTGSGNDIVDVDLGGIGTLHLGAGNDSAHFGSVSDMVVFGGSGRDLVRGVFGNSIVRTESGDDRIHLERDSSNIVVDGGPNRDLVLVENGTGNTCTRVERVEDFDGNPATCH